MMSGSVSLAERAAIVAKARGPPRLSKLSTVSQASGKLS